MKIKETTDNFLKKIIWVSKEILKCISETEKKIFCENIFK